MDAITRNNGKQPVTKRWQGKPGPPSKCTPQLIRRVAKMARLGMSQRMIADALGVTEVVMSQWKAGNADLFKVFNKSRMRGVQDKLQRIDKAGRKGQWTADAWWLERKFPDEFARRTELTGAGGAPLEGNRTLVIMWPDEAGNGHAKPQEVIEADEVQKAIADAGVNGE